MPKDYSEVLELDLESISNAAMVLRAFKNDIRLKILLLLHKKKKLTVTSIYEKLKIDQPTASLHLAILRKEGIVMTEKVSPFVYYSVNYDRIKQIEKHSKLIVDYAVPQENT